MQDAREQLEAIDEALDRSLLTETPPPGSHQAPVYGFPYEALRRTAYESATLARRRLRWTLIGGSVLQVLVIAAGAIVPVMYFLGAIFAVLWVIGIGLGRRFGP